MKNREHTIEFTKDKLNRKIKSGFKGWLFAKGIEALCIYLGKQKQTYYAQWSIKKIKPDGKAGSTGVRKKLGSYQIPLDEIKQLLRASLDEWKRESTITNGSNTTPVVADIVRKFIAEGVDGERLRSKKRKDYKASTSKGYIDSLKAHILCEGKNSSKKYKELFAKKIRYRGDWVTGALKDVPLKDVTRKDVEIFMHRLKHKPSAANNALAALSVAFEYDIARSHNQLYQGTNNPCLRVVKYETNKDKRFLDLDKVLEIRSYIENNLHKNNSIYTPHFLAFFMTCLEVGERQADLFGMYWKKPNNILEAQEKGCTGYIDLEKRLVHGLDSKDRDPFAEQLTIEGAEILKRLDEMRYERLSWCIKSPFIFPQTANISEPISHNSFRWQRDRFMYKFGLGTRTLVRSKKTRKLYKYKCKYTLKHLRKTFVTHYGREKGLEAASLRMRHSSPVVTKEHYFTENKAALDVDHMYSPKKERQQHKLAAVKGGKND